MAKFIKLKWISVTLILTLIACSAQDDTVRPDFKQPTFYLSELPELEPFEIPPEIASRYGGVSYNDKLVPASDYGILYPYEGKRMASEFWSSSRYGLVDARGRIVVDPVYESAYYLNSDMEYLCLVYPQERMDPRTPGAESMPRKMIIAKADGSWVSGKYEGNWASLSEDRVIMNYESVVQGRYSPNFKIYDLEGQLLAEGQGQISGFSEGLGIMQRMEYDQQNEGNKVWYQYIDKSGQVVIPGPFLNAQDFKDGKAIVCVGEDWETILYGVIDRKGKYLIKPAKENEYLRYSTNEQEYYIFDEETRKIGIKHKSGKIIVPAEYNSIDLPWNSEIAVACYNENGEYFIIRLPDGGKKKIDFQNIHNAYIIGNDWCYVEYDEPPSVEDGKQGIIYKRALIKDDREYSFDCQYGQSLYCSFIEDDLIALNYYSDNREMPRDFARVDIFDGSLGKVIKSLNGWQYSYSVSDKLRVFSPVNTGRMLILNQRFEPQFPAETFGASGGLISFHLVADGIYQARTTFSSGLLKENGEWLIRVNISNTD